MSNPRVYPTPGACLKPAVAIAGVALGAALGFAVGWAWPRTVPSGVPTATEASSEEVPNTPERSEPSVSTMVCARGPEDVTDLRARWCEAQLGEHERRARMVQVPWPDAEHVSPDAWMARVEDAIATCNLPFELGTVECTEYPCAATVTWTGEGEPDEWVARDCAPLEGLQAGVTGFPVRCPDGTLVEVPVFMATDEEVLSGAIAERVDDDTDGWDEILESVRLLARRADAAVSTFECP